LDIESKNALIEARDVLRDLSGFLAAVHDREDEKADPALLAFSSRIGMVACELDAALIAGLPKEKTA
jgi:hypothetical protein